MQRRRPSGDAGGEDPGLLFRRQSGQPEPADGHDALYQEAQAIFREEPPWLPIAHSVVFTALRKEVQGYVMDPFGLHVFKDVRLQD